MMKRAICWLFATLTCTAAAAPPPPAPGNLFGWELPRLQSIDTISFPRRLVRSRSYGRVVAEIHLWRDGSQREIDFTLRAERRPHTLGRKDPEEHEFSPAKLDGSPLASRLPVHVVFLPEDGRSSTPLRGMAAHRLDQLPVMPAGPLPGDQRKPGPGARARGCVRLPERGDGARSRHRVRSLCEQGWLARRGTSHLHGGRRIHTAGAGLRRGVADPPRAIPEQRLRMHGCASWWAFSTTGPIPRGRSIAPCESYRGWPAPVVTPVALLPVYPPQFVTCERRSGRLRLGPC